MLNSSIPDIDMVNDDNSSDNNKWKLAEGLSGTAIAFLVTLIFLVSLPSNAFIVLHFFCNIKKCFENSSTLFLFNLSLSDLFLVFFYMPLVVISTSTREWLAGSTDQVRSIFCQIHGFIFNLSITLTTFLLCAISIDHLLYIAKADTYHNIVTKKITIGSLLLIWIAGLVSSTSSFYIRSVEFCFNSAGGCRLHIKDDIPTLIIYALYSFIAGSIFVVTNTWTFLYTCCFLRKRLKRLKQTLSSENYDIQRNKYLQNIKGIFGIFGILLVFHTISAFSTFIRLIHLIAHLTGNVEKLPVELDAILSVGALFHAAISPIIQIFFRKDLRSSLKMILRTIFKRNVGNTGQRQGRRRPKIESEIKKEDHYTQQSNSGCTAVGNKNNMAISELELHNQSQVVTKELQV